MRNKICRYNKYGYCRYGDKCHFRHNNEICVDDKCDVFECDKRHPIFCKYYGSFKKCKYQECAYKHEVINDMKTVDDKINNIEKKLRDEQPNVKIIEKKLVAFEKEYETKIKGLENQLKKMNNLMEENNSKFIKQEQENAALKVKIETLESTTKEIKKKQVDVETKINKVKVLDFENKIKCLENTVKKFEESNEIFLEKIKKQESKKYKCSECTYEATSERGLKTHIGRKHQAENGNFPRTCDLCDFQIKNRKDMKKHMLSHSYKRVEFNCDECDFYGRDDLAMEMQYRKTHSYLFECVLCESKFIDEEMLELHTFIC